MTHEDENRVQWLMEACIPSATPLEGFLPSPDLAGLNMNLIPELEGIEFRSVINAAVQAGLVDLRLAGADEEYSLDRWLLNPRRRVYVDLTAKGGEWWEERAKPDWNAYVDSGFLDNSTYEARCAIRAPLERWLRYDVLVSGMKPIESSIRWEEERSWKPTSWKNLASCHRLQYRFEKDSKAARVPPPLWLCEWELSRSTWYRSVQPPMSAKEIWMNIMVRAGFPAEIVKTLSDERPVDR